MSGERLRLITHHSSLITHHSSLITHHSLLITCMPFPEHIDRVFQAFGIAADTKAALYDLYVAMGPEVLEVFSDIADDIASPPSLRPEHCASIRQRVVERYLRRNHPRWLAGTPTPSLY